jgi:cyclase
MLDVVRQVAEQCFMPFTVGGGIRTIDDVTSLVQAGAEKVSINTAAVVDPPIVSQTARRFGRCATVVNIDPKRVSPQDFEAHRRERMAQGGDAGEVAAATEGAISETADGREYVYEVHTHGGRHPTGLEAVAWARRVVELGAGEIVLTSMDADGTKDGYDLGMLSAVSQAVDVPIVASGGCGEPEHMVAAIRAGADAALAASIFHYGEYSIAQTKQYMSERGIPVRVLAPVDS